MATYSGWGAFTKLISGRLRIGYKNDGVETIYADVYATTSMGTNTYYGIQLVNTQVIRFSTLRELYLGDAKCFTGDVCMFTEFTDNTPFIQDDPDALPDVTRKSAYYSFGCGIFLGKSVINDDSWWNNTDDDYTVIPEDDDLDGGRIGTLVTEQSGYQKRWIKPIDRVSRSESDERSFTAINWGELRFGYVVENPYSEIYKCAIRKYSVYQSDGNLNGIEVEAETIHINPEAKSDESKNLIYVGNVYTTKEGATGYMRYISDISVSSSGVFWQVDELPFICGLCVGKNETIFSS